MNAQAPPQRSAAFLILCLVLLTVGFRVVRLTADPPGDFDWSGGYFADEGYWSHNARNAVLFGNPVQDEWDGRVMSPLFAAFQNGVFRLFGVGIAQVRFSGIFAALLLTVATFFLVRQKRDAAAAFLCAVVVSLNYPLLVLARQGILDPFGAALAWAALALACSGSTAAAALAGILFVSATVTKFFMIYAVVPIGVSLLIPSNARVQRCLAFVGAALAAGAVWFFGNYLPHREILAAYNRFYASQQAQQWEIVELVKNVVMQPFYLYGVKTPALLFLGNLMLWYFLARPRESERIERACWTWLLTGILFFALWRYRPLRYYTSLLPPLAVLAALGLGRLEDVSAALRERRSAIWLILGFLVPAAQMALVLADRFFHLGRIPEQLGIRSFDAVVFLALSTLAFVVLVRYPRKVSWIRIACCAAFVICDLGNYTGWMIRPEYAAREISADLQQRIGDGVLSGQWASELTLENRLRAVPVWKGFVNSDAPFERYGITHLVLWRYPLGDEVLKFEEWYPEEMKHFHPVATYRIKDSDLTLFEREDWRPAGRFR